MDNLAGDDIKRVLDKKRVGHLDSMGMGLDEGLHGTRASQSGTDGAGDALLQGGANCQCHS